MAATEPGGKTATAWSAQVTIPDSIEGARGQLGEVADLLLAGDWRRAAIVYAFTEPQQGKRTDTQATLEEAMTSDSPVARFAITEFAALGIRGLSSHVTVRKYREAWQAAMDAGKAAEAVPGKPVELPDMDWPRGEGGGSAETGAGREADWQTPLAIVQAAREALGGTIDLDPATTVTANKTIGAAKIWTAEKDGLTREWAGRMFLSPPAYQPELTQFCMKAATEHAGGRVTHAVVVLPADTAADHVQNLGAIAAALCLPKGRLRFWHPEREDGAGPARASLIFYLGPDPSTFHAAFAEFGMVW
jgi:hypothetical protein